MARKFALPLFGLLVVVCCGCSDGLATVSGTVTLDGQPLAGGQQMYGTVTYSLASGGGAPAVGLIDESGTYVLKTGARDGLAPGQYKVGIAMKRITIPEDPAGLPLSTLVTPKKYASTKDSGLVAKVQPGSNTFDFALSSK